MTEWERGEYRVTDERDAVDIEIVTSLLNSTYWAAGREREVIERSIENSTPFSLYRGSEQIGFARAVTDEVTFAWIGDLVIEPGSRGKGLGRWMMQCVMEHPGVRGAAQKFLRTRDAQGLYRSFGFEVRECMSTTALPAEDGE
jgi:GNAT superfamily N-acetyltransferase